MEYMKFATLILIGCIIIITHAGCCLSQSHYGTEFVFGIPHNHHNENQCKEIYVSIAAFTTGTYNFTVPYLNISKTGTIQSNLTEIKLNCSIAKFGTFTDRRGLYLKTSTEVAVYATNYESDTAESFLVIPVPETGKQYSTAAYQPVDSSENRFVLVAASSPETHGCIYNDTSGRFVTNFSLNPLEVYQLSTSDTLHGIRVIADKQVAVITGTTCATIPHSISACDIITEQMIPTKSWDKIYIAPPTPPKEAYELRVTKTNSSVSGQICFHNQTSYYCGNDSTISMRMGNRPTVIVSDNPISVVQFGFGNGYPLSGVGDPFMTVIPGLGNFLNNYSFAIPNIYRNAQNHLSIIIPTKYIQGLVLDGLNLTIAHNDMLNVSEPLDNYTVVILNVSSGYHHLYHTKNYVKFGLLIYGLGTTSDKYVGFGYPGGMRLSGSDTFTTPTTNIAVTSPLPDGNKTNTVLSSTQAIGNSNFNFYYIMKILFTAFSDKKK
ncbi:uncharacterized protein LOC123540518 [Mercenaria mercenaria]|uniref:uncharacterized protein LOC123540518 n=1 Tax=Mercenaria mercenaria TaxID=6596 RepID=UPI00234F7C01|nr:uncharacterized protein LOC123540518 [Mercenaria mercenaria]